MKQLLLLSCSAVAALCLGVLASHADVASTTRPQPLPQSRPAADSLLAQTPTEAGNPYITMCLKGCDSSYAVCRQHKPGDAGCGDEATRCKAKCRN